MITASFIPLAAFQKTLWKGKAFQKGMAAFGRWRPGFC